MSGIRASTGRTLSNIPPSTTVLRHFLLYTHSLHASWHNSTFSSEHLCPPLWSHSSLCISSPNRSLLSAHYAHIISSLLSGSCSGHIQCPNDSRAHRYASYLLKTPHILRTIMEIISEGMRMNDFFWHSLDVAHTSYLFFVCTAMIC